MIKLAPSILSADFCNLGAQVKTVEETNTEFLHIDIMDGSFVPNISFGFPVIKALRKNSKMIFDVHLMIENPSKYIDEFVNCGADIITFHYEAERHIDRTVNYIKNKGCKVGIALNPATPVSVLKNILPSLDMVLIMSVNPGFGGQSFIEYSIDKIQEVKNLAKKLNKQNLLIEVDGGVDTHNIKSIVEAGANVLVAGSAVFRENKIKENINALNEALR